MCKQPPLVRKPFFFLKESNKDMIWTLGFQSVSALVLITEFHSWIARAVLHDLLPVVVLLIMAYFKIPTIQIKLRKKISMDGLSELSVFFGIENYNLLQFLDVMDSFEETLFWTVFSPYSTKISPTWKYSTCSYISSPSTCYSQRP